VDTPRPCPRTDRTRQQRPRLQVVREETIRIPGLAGAEPAPFVLRGKPQSGESRWRLAGRGMPAARGRAAGDMVVELRVLSPLEARVEQLLAPARRWLAVVAHRGRVRSAAVLRLLWDGFAEGVRALAALLYTRVIEPAGRHPLAEPARKALPQAPPPVLIGHAASLTPY